MSELTLTWRVYETVSGLWTVSFLTIRGTSRHTVADDIEPTSESAYTLCYIINIID